MRGVERKMGPVIALALASVLAATAAAAQDKEDKPEAPTGATPTKITFDERRCSSVVDASKPPTRLKTGDLAADYDDGSRWPALQDRLRQILDSCDLPAPASDVATVVTFIAGEKPYTVVLPATQPYALTMLGKKEILVVVLVNGEEAVAAPTDFKFMSKRLDDPLVGAIPSFVRAITDAAGKGLSVQVQPPPPQDGKTPPPPAIMAYATQVSVPFSRASIAESGTVQIKVNTETKKVPVAATYANTPLSRLRFSTLAGGLVGKVRGPEKMKVDSGSYASDPLGRAAIMAAVMFHRPFDSTVADMSKAERFAGFAGAVLSPAAGFGAGLSVGIIRGLSANVGYMWVWVPTSSNGAATGTAAVEGNQLSHKVNRGLFIGGGYVFKAD